MVTAAPDRAALRTTREWTSDEQLGVAASVTLEQFRQGARESQERFAELVMRDERGKPQKLAAIHRVMHLHIEACRRANMHCCLLAPFGHGKTGQVVGRIARSLGMDTNVRWKIVCASDPRALERAQAVRALIATPRYRMVFPNVRFVDPGRKAKREGKMTRDTGHAFYLDRSGFSLDASVHAVGIVTSGTGGRCDEILFDDIVDQRNALDNPALRRKVIENLDQVWLQRLEPHGHALFLGTPWHEGDAIAHVLREPGWCTLRVMVASDLSRLEMEVVNPPPDYPLPRANEKKKLSFAAA